MQKKTILITGAAGEIGQALVRALAAAGTHRLLTLDLAPMPAELAALTTHVRGSVADPAVLEQIAAEHHLDTIFHLAALLSTRAEHSPALAHEVNVEASVLLLELAAAQSAAHGEAVKFLFPSSMAVYGLPSLEAKHAAGALAEEEHLHPTTMYGANKLAVELLGSYYAENYRQLDEQPPVRVDFRALRFPGLISAFTLPTGGTSDYGPEMLHAAAQGQAYACFVRPDATIPFMAMPDGVRALLQLAAAPRAALTRHAYNVTSFSLSAEAFRQQVLAAFPAAQITFAPHAQRQGIVDAWPMDMQDAAARADWGWAPELDQARCFDEYLVPAIRQRYQAA
ncbi:MAG: NAD-dependent epimerase/dehydratase family protein [Anaerolineales bacterium]|nr:NAD-dependent epimerase/dehydratase family protein [Anaerolineales bacterium]